jgi:hypothetical protein
MMQHERHDSIKNGMVCLFEHMHDDAVHIKQRYRATGKTPA